MTIPVITLHQPWATWIMNGWKGIETRTHNRFRSLKGQTIGIHAGLSTDGLSSILGNPYLSEEQKGDSIDLLNGYLLGTALVYDFKKLDAQHSNSSLIECENTERYGLFLSNIKEFDKPILVKGGQGIWYFDCDKCIKVPKPTVQTKMELV